MKRLLITLLCGLLASASADAQVGGLAFPGPGPRVSTGGGGSVAVTASSATFVNGSTTSLTVPLTIPAGSNLAAAVMVIWANSSVPTGAAATWNGSAMTAVTGTSGGNGACSCSTQIYGIVAPATGAHNFVISWTGSFEAHAVGLSFSGANQTSVATAFPNGTNVIQLSATASPITGPVTSAANHIVIAFGAQNVSPWGTINGTTIATDSSTGPNFAVAANYNTGAATVNPSFAFTGTAAWAFFATDVSP